VRVKDPRVPGGWRNEGPSSAEGEPFGDLGGVGSGYKASGAVAEGRCPICGVKMSPRGNQRTCIKTKDSSWAAMRRRGRGGYLYGNAMRAS